MGWPCTLLLSICQVTPVSPANTVLIPPPPQLLQTALSCFNESLPFGDRPSSVSLSAISRMPSFCCQLLRRVFFFFNAAFLYVIKLYCETIPLVTPLLEFRMEEAPWAYLHEGRFSAMVLSVPAVRTTSVGVAGTRDVGPLSTKVVFELNKCTESAFLQS